MHGKCGQFNIIDKWCLLHEVQIVCSTNKRGGGSLAYLAPYSRQWSYGTYPTSQGQVSLYRYTNRTFLFSHSSKSTRKSGRVSSKTKAQYNPSKIPLINPNITNLVLHSVGFRNKSSSVVCRYLVGS